MTKKYPKGSKEAKEFMAKLRAMRGKGKGVMNDKPRSTLQVRRGMKPMGTGGEGIGTDDESDMEGCGLGVVHIHHHHHLHGEGWLDDAGNFFKNAGNTIKSGFEDKIINPIQQGFQDKIINPVQQKVINPIENLPKEVQSKVQALQGTPAYDMIVNRIGKGYIAKKKGGLATDILHYGIPAAAGTLGSALGTSAGLTLAGGMPMAGLAGGMAGSALGNRLGEQWAAKAQRETGTGIRRRKRT